MKHFLCTIVLLISLLAGTAIAQTAQLPDFTYQGQLQQSGQPANGAFDLSFALYDAETGGQQVGTAIDEPQFPVTNGLFMVRGFRRSKGRSAMRLKAMANERMPTMAAVKISRVMKSGVSRLARKAPA